MFLLKALLVFLTISTTLALVKVNRGKNGKIFKFSNNDNFSSKNYMNAFLSILAMINGNNQNPNENEEDAAAAADQGDDNDIVKNLIKQKEDVIEKQNFLKKYVANRFKGASSFYRDFHTMRI
jgi:hypothetical protein